MSSALHATTVAIDGQAVVLLGPSGAGKSDLALRLIDRGAVLVSDDYTAFSAVDGGLYAAPPPTIAGRIEVRGVGIVEMSHVADVPVALVVTLMAAVERMPDEATMTIGGIDLPAITLNPFEASAPIKVHLALARVKGAA